MSRLLTPSQIFMARELREQGVAQSRIAELLDVDEDALAEALKRLDEVSEPKPEPAEPEVEPLVASKHPDWPPPVDEHTRWKTLRVGRSGRSQDVRVRTVRLWSKDVLINTSAEVWCPQCRAFSPVSVLGAPGNHHSVGIRRSDGLIWASTGEADPEPVGPPGGLLGLMSTPW